jgi:hypothetical protein
MAPTTAQRLTALETGLAELLNLARESNHATASPSCEATPQAEPQVAPATAKPSRTKRAKAIEARKAENLARGLNPQAQAVCPSGHTGHDGQLRWGIKPSWVCANCHERKELSFKTKMPKARK